MVIFESSFEDEVRAYLRVLRTLHLVALAGYASPAVAHGVGGGDDFAAVVSGVTETDEVDHGIAP
jgi:hypothetical protein